MTLNTGIAGLFVTFTKHITWWLIGSLLALAVGGFFAMVTLTSVTRKIGKGEIYTLPSSRRLDLGRPLFWMHLASAIALLVGIVLFCVFRFHCFFGGTG